MDPSSGDPLAAVRRLVEARRQHEPGDQATRLLEAALQAAEQLAALDEAEAIRRVDAAVRVLGVVGGPAPHDSRAGAREAEAARPDDAAGPRSRPHARPTPSDAHKLPGALVSDGTRGARREGPGTRGGPLTPEAVTRPGAPLIAAHAPEPGTRGGRRPDGRPAPSEVSAALSDLARVWAEQGRGSLPSEPLELLAELVRTGVPEGGEAARFHVALLRGVDLALNAARYLPCEDAIAARARPLLRAAIEGAERCGVQVHPSLALGPRDPPCPVNAGPAFGDARDAVVWVDQHGFALPDGRVEPAQVRVAVGPQPPWFEPLRDGYAALVRLSARLPDGPAQVRAYRGWIDELPGLTDAERRGTTLRYAASALFVMAESDGAARNAFDRLAYALEREGSFVIPLEPSELADARRYELVLRPGAGPPRVLRPGFQGAGVVQQRARILADPAWLGTMSS